MPVVHFLVILCWVSLTMVMCADSCDPELNEFCVHVSLKFYFELEILDVLFAINNWLFAQIRPTLTSWGTEKVMKWLVRHLFKHNFGEDLLKLKFIVRIWEVSRDGHGYRDSPQDLLPPRRWWGVSSGRLRRLLDTRAREFSSLWFDWTERYM